MCEHLNWIFRLICPSEAFISGLLHLQIQIGLNLVFTVSSGLINWFPKCLNHVRRNSSRKHAEVFHFPYHILPYAQVKQLYCSYLGWIHNNLDSECLEGSIKRIFFLLLFLQYMPQLLFRNPETLYELEPIPRSFRLRFLGSIFPFVMFSCTLESLNSWLAIISVRKFSTQHEFC